MSISWAKRYGIVWSRTKKKMACPICGTEGALVTSGALSSDGAMRLRHRRCAHCGERWKTVEIDADRFVDLLEAEEQIDEYRQKVKSGIQQIDRVKGILYMAVDASEAFDEILRGGNEE